MKTYKLKIGWLYPELMSTYGDRGNIITLQKRCQWREIETEIAYLSLHFNPNQLSDCDLLLMGGAQDRQQQIVVKDLMRKREALLKMIEKEIPGLYICGAYQFLGKYYKEADGSIIKCLDILDFYTESPGLKSQRLIGNIAIETNETKLIGFENHGGRTYLGKKVMPLGKVLIGSGNNGVDQTEGALYKNSFCTYLHGPILPKNPEFADHLIKLALELKYDLNIKLKILDDSLEKKARNSIANRLDIEL